MSNPLSTLLARMRGELPPVRRIERALAKRYVLRRLRVVYPHLQGNPAALEAAYRELDLELTEVETDTGVLIYEMHTPHTGAVSGEAGRTAPPT